LDAWESVPVSIAIFCGSIRSIMNVARIMLGMMVGMLLAQESPSPPFRAETELVIAPFHVSRGNRFVSDLQPADVVLLEDGRQRDFSVFEGASAEQRLPLELVLLFDKTGNLGTMRRNQPDVERTYDFVKHWDDATSRALLVKDGWDIRASVYQFNRRALQKICPVTSDPQEFLNAFRKLLEPISGGTIPLKLPPGQAALTNSGMANDWPLEAATGTLKDATTVPGKAARMLVIISEGTGNTSTVSTDVADAANAVGIPVYPVVLTYQLLLQRMTSEKTLRKINSAGISLLEWKISGSWDH
jgi:hypothetical protein